MGIAAAVSAAASVIGTGAAIKGQIDARRGAKKSREAQAEQSRLQASASRRQAIRQSRAARAESLAQSQAIGGQAGSGETGGIGSLSSQLGSQIGLQNQLSALSGVVGQGLSQQSKGRGLSSLGGAFISLGPTFGSLAEKAFPKQAATPTQQTPTIVQSTAAFSP